MARGQTSSYASGLDANAGTGPIAPNPANAAGGTQLPVGGTSTATTDLFHTIFPVSSGVPLPGPPSSPANPTGGNLMIDPKLKLATTKLPPFTPAAPGAPRLGRPGIGGSPFNPFFGPEGNR